MNIIDQLITAKKTKKDIPLLDIIKELIKYEKLSKMDKFKHIVDSPILQKQLPYCWSAFNSDAQAFWLLSEASTILQNVSTTELIIYQDLNMHYNAKKQKQMKIIGNVNKYPFIYDELDNISELTPDQKATITYITEDIDDNIINVTGIYQTPSSTIVYSGSIPKNRIKQQISETQVALSIEPYTKNGISIMSYSPQGNNDYYFAKNETYQISMPDSKTIQFIDTKSKITNVYLSNDDIRTLNLKKSNIEVLADMIYKYLPKTQPVEQSDMTQSNTTYQ